MNAHSRAFSDGGTDRMAGGFQRDRYLAGRQLRLLTAALSNISGQKVHCTGQ
jgi:hypothetical protein